jgi:hypothetical protein
VVESCDMHTAVKLCAVPLKSPNNAANWMRPLVELALSHRVRMDKEHGRLVRIMVLNLPHASAKNPGKERPAMEGESV